MISKYSKFIVAIIGALITWAIATYPSNTDVQTWVSLASAILTALGVYQVKNTSGVGDSVVGDGK